MPERGRPPGAITSGSGETPMASARRSTSFTRCSPPATATGKPRASHFTRAIAPCASTNPDALPARRPGEQRRPVTALGGDREIVGPPELAQERETFAGARALRQRKDSADVGIALQDAFGAAEDQHIDCRVRPRMFQAADQRRREQHIAKPPQRDDQNARACGQRNHADRSRSAIPPSTPTPNA